MFGLSKNEIITAMKRIRDPDQGLYWDTPSTDFTKNGYTGGTWYPTVDLSEQQIADGKIAPFIEIELAKAPVFLLRDPEGSEYQHLAILTFSVGRQDFLYAPHRTAFSVRWLTFDQGFDLAMALVAAPIHSKPNYGLSVLKRLLTPSPAA